MKSVGWCMPRYIREVATPTGMITASATKSHRHQRSVRANTMIAMATQRQMVAAMCPDGKDEVGICPSRFSTGGRGRSTTPGGGEEEAQLAEHRQHHEEHRPPAPPDRQHERAEDQRDQQDRVGVAELAPPPAHAR